MTYKAKKWREVPAKDFLPALSHILHPTLTIPSPTTPLGEAALIFLQNASKETLKELYDECVFQDAPRVSLTFCRRVDEKSHTKIELNHSSIMGINLASGKVLRHSCPEIAHDTTYHYVAVEL